MVNLKQRWEHFNENYQQRDKLAKSLIPEDIKSVMDLGAGNQNLQSYFVPKKIEYSPVDKIKRFPNTLIADFNRNQFPPIVSDLSIVLGVLEYINNAPKFIKSITNQTVRYIIFSYYGAEDTPQNIRKKWGWKNNYTVQELKDMFGWEVIKELKEKKQTIILMKRK